MPTQDEMDQYGAGLSIWDQIRLFQDWAPLIGYGQRFINEPDQYQRSPDRLGRLRVAGS